MHPLKPKEFFKNKTEESITCLIAGQPKEFSIFAQVIKDTSVPSQHHGLILPSKCKFEKGKIFISEGGFASQIKVALVLFYKIAVVCNCLPAPSSQNV